MQNPSTVFSKQYYIIWIPVLLMIFLFLVFKISGIIKNEIDLNGLLSFDASWYNDIVKNGYNFNANVQSNSGFYPTFSFFWKASHLSSVGISILNAIIFFFSVYLLARNFELNNKELLLLLSIPSLIFNFVPYTEALFFLSGTMLLIGLQKKKTSLIIAGIFFSCFIRPCSVIFIPSLLFLHLLSGTYSKSKILNTTFLIGAAIIPFFIVAIIQWEATGIWFAHAKSQITNWDHRFHIPRLPLTTWAGPKTIWLDGTAFWMGLLAAGFCILVLFSKKKIKEIDKPLYFSLAYLSGVTLFVLFFNGYNDRGSTSLLSLNRYFFATPFFFIAFQKFLRFPQLSGKNYLYLIISVIIICLLFGAYTQIDWFNRSKTIVYFSFLTISITGYLIILNHKWFLKKNFWILIYFTNCILQTYLFFRFLSGEWVG